MEKPSRLLSFIGWSFFLLWIYWNVHWWLKGELAPSALQYFTDIPVASTGMTRSLIAMANHEWSEAFLWNPFTLPLIALFLWSLSYVAYQFWQSKKLTTLPSWTAKAWVILLIFAQITKFIIGPTRW